MLSGDGRHAELDRSTSHSYGHIGRPLEGLSGRTPGSAADRYQSPHNDSLLENAKVFSRGWRRYWSCSIVSGCGFLSWMTCRKIDWTQRTRSLPHDGSACIATWGSVERSTRLQQRSAAEIFAGLCRGATGSAFSNLRTPSASTAAAPSRATIYRCIPTWITSRRWAPRSSNRPCRRFGITRNVSNS